MRKCFIDTLIECAKEDESIALLMAEVGFSVVEPFEQLFPERFINVGIAEQSLILSAAGMALKGMRPVALSMSAFLPSRAFEMIKVSICYQKLPVILVAIGSGLSYGELGSTHHAIEESAIMRSLPNMQVVFPSNACELKNVLRHALKDNKPYYISIPKIPAPQFVNPTFSYGKATCYCKGKDASILAFGSSVGQALEARSILEKQGFSVGVYGFHAAKPLDEDAILAAHRASNNLIIIDEHNICGGIGGEVARVLLQNHKTVNVFREIGITDCFQYKVARYGELLEQYGITASRIVQTIEETI